MGDVIAGAREDAGSNVTVVKAAACRHAPETDPSASDHGSDPHSLATLSTLVADGSAVKRSPDRRARPVSQAREPL
jgi:hypothetical protein